MSRYPDKASAVRIPIVVIAMNLLDRPITFGGYTPDTGDCQFLRGVVVPLIRGPVFGVAR